MMSDEIKMYRRDIEKIIIESGLAERSGGLLYSSYETLRKGDWYFLGQNPGGEIDSEDEYDKIIKHIYNSDPCFNAYFDEKWEDKQGRICSAGSQHHQVNIKKFFSILGVDLRETCSSNLSFVRSRTTQSYSGSLLKDAKLCWKVHQYLLNIVRPKNILCNGSKASDFILRNMKNVKYALHQKKKVSNKLTCYSYVGDLLLSNTDKPLTNVRLFSVPHLGIYRCYPEAAQWVSSLAQ
tara:strand:+ start:14491 stop:15201 length:711 start_codon:yes stop_codon:yes gene_type:complete